MQMVGATKSFIRKPFVMRSIKLGMLGAGLAIIALIGVAIRRLTSSDLGILDNKILIAAVLLAVLGIGILITWLSTHFATQKFLNLRTDDLY
jgi:cell division transport system permease protein